MTAQPEHDSWTTPTWMVQAVFDPDEPWRDFAYTIGLADLGLPEVHIRCHPSLGSDAAPDWKLSQSDMCRVLNDVGARLGRGALHVGDTWSAQYDTGLSVVRYRLDPAEDRDDLEAFGIAPDATVLPLRWELERVPRGERAGLSSTEEASARTAYAEIVRALPRPFRAPPGWELPDELSFDVDQRYGPRTPLVLARAAQIWTMSADLLAELTVVAAEVDDAGSLSYASACASAEARPLGLDDATEQLSHDVASLCQMTAAPRWARTWEETVRLCVGDDPDFRTGNARRKFGRGLRSLLADTMNAAVHAEVLGADASPSTRLAGLGPLLATLTGEGVAPGDDWVATERVIKELRLLLLALKPPTLVELARKHASARIDDPAYDAVVRKLLGWAVTSAACGPLPQVFGSSRANHLVVMGALGGAQPGSLQTWCTCVTSALTHRVRLTAEEVASFSRPFGELIRGLEQRINAPI